MDLNEGKREFLTTQEETLFMQVFVEEVGLWMDSMDPMKHVRTSLPRCFWTWLLMLISFLGCCHFILCKSLCCLMPFLLVAHAI